MCAIYFVKIDVDFESFASLLAVVLLWFCRLF